MTVHFIGAGPGAADLITVRGRDLLARCPVCLYAGSIVPTEMLDWCGPETRLIDTAAMSLDEIEAEYVRAHEAGMDVARLHSGDLSIWSAVAGVEWAATDPRPFAWITLSISQRCSFQRRTMFSVLARIIGLFPGIVAAARRP